MEILKPHLKNYLGAIFWCSHFRSLWLQVHLYCNRVSLQFILDNLLKNDRQAMFKDGMLLIALAVIGVIAGILNVYFAARVAQGVTSDLRQQTYEKIQTFSLSNIEKFSASTLVVRLINDMNQVLNVVMTTFYASFTDADHDHWGFCDGDRDDPTFLVVTSGDVFSGPVSDRLDISAVR